MSSKKRELINPVRVFLAILIVALVWFVPIAFPLRGKEAAEIKESRALVYVFASSADACPFACIKCTSWEEGVWPRGCLTWECDGGCESDPGGGGNQPPTISQVLTCTQSGVNGWCIGNLSLDLTASDPQGSQVVISGDVNGIAFTCTAGMTCSVPLPEGVGSADYRVDASSTGLFATGNTSYLLDTSTPQLNGMVSGVDGANSWYKSDVILTVAASDAVSRIASVIANVDGVNSNYQSPITLSDGIHTVVLTAADNAGNVTQNSQTFNIDTVTPILNISLSGSMGLNNWYISNVTVTPSVNDSGSGLALLEVSVDGSAFTNYQSPIIFSDGFHSYQFRATDNAGNITQTALQQIKVDATIPTISLKINGTRGQNDWYVSDVNVTPTVSDGGSGVGLFEALVDGGTWIALNSPLSFTDGIHSYQYRITDNAGNVTLIPVQQIKVDTVLPVIAMDDELKLGETLYYDLEDPVVRSSQISGLWGNRQVIEDDTEKYKKVAW
ncbi:MAG: Ig-like domain-containing protein [Anaerolineales bacterium]